MRKRQKGLKWIAAILFTAMMALGMLDMSVLAVQAETVGAFIVTGGVLNIDYSYVDGVLTVNTNTSLTIANTDSNTATTDRIFIASGVDADITLAGVNIDVSRKDRISAFQIADDSTGNVSITLAEGTTNTLKSGFYRAGLQKNGTEGSLSIKGAGELSVAGGYNGAGIGGGHREDGILAHSSNIVISGGIITVTGGSYASGIGGGFSGDYEGGNGSNIIISGGNVTVNTYSGDSRVGAGIGGSYYGAGSDITISGGTVTVNSYEGGAGIGGGSSGNGTEGTGSDITISGGMVTVNCYGEGAGIGGGYRGSASNITISGGNVNVNAVYGAGIGGGGSNSRGNIAGNCENVIISGGTVVAVSQYGAGIGCGKDSRYEYYPTASNITISGGTVTATGGQYSAGIGGGNFGKASNITISGGSVKVSGGARAIGGGSYGNGNVVPTNGTANVYPVIIPNPNGETVKIDNIEYTYDSHTAADASDKNLYVYLTGESHDIVVGGTERRCEFDGKLRWVPVLSDFNYTAPSDEELIYSGTAKTATVTATDGITGMGEIEIVYYKIGSPEAVEPIEAGEYKVKINVAMGDSYTEMTGLANDAWSFRVERATPVVAEHPTVGTRIYHPSAVLGEFSLTGGKVLGVDGNPISGIWSWKNEAAFPITVNDSGYVAVFTPTDSINYNEVEVNITVPVNPAELTIEKVKAAGRPYDTTKEVAVTEVSLAGVYATDVVTADCTGLVGILSSANIGTYSSLILPESLVLEGADAGNYVVKRTIEPVIIEDGVEIVRADAEITIGTADYNKTFGDADFALDVTDTNTEADVQYVVISGTDVVSVADGTVSVLNAGTAVITAKLSESANYNAAADETITINVGKKVAPAVDTENRSYYYARANADIIDLAALLPKDCGTASYGIPTLTGEVTYSTIPTVQNGKISYTVDIGTVGKEGNITVIVSTRNYEDITIVVSVEQIDQLPVSLKENTEVTVVNNPLVYGMALSELKFNSAVFVDGNGVEIAGTLAWKEPAAMPNTGTTSAVWVFTPNDEAYAKTEGVAAITVAKAVPIVSVVPTVADRVYHPTAALVDSDLTGGTVSVAGSWSWQTTGMIPTVNNSGYMAIFTPEDTANYETVIRNIAVTVSKGTPRIQIQPTASAIIYGDSLALATLANGVVQYSSSDNTVVAGSFSWKDTSMKPTVADSNKTMYSVIFTPEDSVNYSTIEGMVTLVVNKAKNAPNMPESTMNVSNICKTIGEAVLPTDWQWQETDKSIALEVGVTVNATAVYNGADKENYENVAVEVAVTRAECVHVGERRDYQNAGCTSGGYTGDTYCKKCGVKLYGGAYISATGHDYVKTITKKATTKTSGIITYACSKCADSYTEIIPKLPVNEAQKEVFETPFIEGNREKDGWKKIENEIKSAKNGDTIVITMNGTTTVPGNLFDEMKNKDIIVVFDMGNGITWSVNGKDIIADNISDIDFGVKLGNKGESTIPVEIINNVTGGRYYINLSLSYNDEFGFKAALTLNVDAANAGLFANLYYYNEETKTLEYICADEIGADGTVELVFTHASEYTIVIDSADMGVVQEALVESTEDANKGIEGTEMPEVDSEAESDWNSWWLVWLIVIVILAAGCIYIMGKKQK